MIISYNWLKNYLVSDLTPQRIAEILTSIGLEVEKFHMQESIRGGLEGVVAGKVLTCEKHADADKLKVTTVDAGGPEPLQIVCGAPNVAAGQTVLVATINTTLYPGGSEEGFKIKKSKIRGVESFGMICAEDELGIGSGHDGIMVLGGDHAPGTPARDILRLDNDYIFEIGLTPNRVDAASHYGVARDLAAYCAAHDIPVQLILPEVKVEGNVHGKNIAVTVQETDAAPRYAGLTIHGVKVGESPQWLRKRLMSVGINPKNNIVDITNFVMHETGQPLHAFDADKIEGGHITVRSCPEGTLFTTLDGVERRLSAEDLMICSDSAPLAIAGVLGGLESGVTDTTSSIFIESAYFRPQTVRKTARRYGLNTDSSFRFERGTDPDMVEFALGRAASLVLEIAGGEAALPACDLYPRKIGPFKFPLDLERLKGLTGIEIPRARVEKILTALEVSFTDGGGNILDVQVPPYRVDVTREADLAEDILRLYGYENIPLPDHVRYNINNIPAAEHSAQRKKISQYLTDNRFLEVMNNSLTKGSYYDNNAVLPRERCVELLNPLSSDLNVMRQSLLFGMLEVISLNINHRNPDLRLYEFGNVYEKTEGDELSAYKEHARLGIALTGVTGASSWNSKPVKTDFYGIKAVAEDILALAGKDIYSLSAERFSDEMFSDGMIYSRSGKAVFRSGSVNRTLLERFDIKQPVYFMEADMQSLRKILSDDQIKFKGLPKYPEVSRDLALVVDKNVTYAQLRGAAVAAEKKFLRRVNLFDVYEGDKIPDGKKSYAMNFILADDSATLTDKNIERIMSNIYNRLKQDCGAELRS